ncbi:hypothetical protein ABLE92_13460 [Gordonia sp. VNQ95]|uniref:hypothetical protein n=1 Tax=Gordonia sp. VNQ95 TaxID=3156619 RepID=UPI0032B4756F
MLWFWGVWTIAFVITLIVITLVATELFLLIFVPFPAFLIAGIIVPWLTPWSLPHIAWAIMAGTAFAVFVTGLIFYGMGLYVGPILFLYAALIRGLLALVFDTRARRLRTAQYA